MGETRLNYDKLIASGKRHPMCAGLVIEYQGGQGGTEYDCAYHSKVECEQCRFFAPNRGRGKNPLAKINNP